MMVVPESARRVAGGGVEIPNPHHPDGPKSKWHFDLWRALDGRWIAMLTEPAGGFNTGMSVTNAAPNGWHSFESFLREMGIQHFQRFEEDDILVEHYEFDNKPDTYDLVLIDRTADTVDWRPAPEGLLQLLGMKTGEAS